jgi:hypothetical protein
LAWIGDCVVRRAGVFGVVTAGEERGGLRA